MRFFIVSCVFPPEPVTSAGTSAHIAKELTQQGHNVQVITNFPNRPRGRLYAEFTRCIFRRTTMDGLPVLRCFSTFSKESRLLSRFLENITFGLTSGLAVLFMKRPDVIYANTWPIFAQGLLMLACKLRHMPLVLSVQDLYPESLVVQKRGFEKTSRSYAFFRWLDAQITRNCAVLIVISEKFKEIYVSDRRIPENKITVIPNWIDDSHTIVTSAGDGIRKTHDIPAGAFLVVYGGNIGTAAGVEHLIDAFQHLLSQENIYLLLAGAGSSLQNCLERIQKYQLERVKIHSPWQASDTFAVLSAADLCILPTQGEQSLVSLPSKLLSYMLAGCCVLALAAPESEIARIISVSQAGWVISTNDSGALANCISDISRLSSNERGSRGQAGRNYVLKHFSKLTNVTKVIEILEQIGGKGG